MLNLEVKERSKKDNLSSLRQDGFMPAVFYGKKQESTPISIRLADFVKVWKNAGESTVVTLKQKEGNLDALIHDVDFDPVTGVPRHADFYVFDKDQKIEIDVPLVFDGVAPGVKEKGGILVKVLHELKIEALPANLPHEIKVDISSLADIHSQITAQELSLPAGVTLLENPEEIVALVSEPQKEEEAPAEPIDISSIEVEKKGKEKEGGEGEEPAAE